MILPSILLASKPLLGKKSRLFATALLSAPNLTILSASRGRPLPATPGGGGGGGNEGGTKVAFSHNILAYLFYGLLFKFNNKASRIAKLTAISSHNLPFKKYSSHKQSLLKERVITTKHIYS
jgi:hypothetical protein